jgi:hypothetical protein
MARGAICVFVGAALVHGGGALTVGGREQKRPPLSIRQGLAGESDPDRPRPHFENLQEVLGKVRESLPSGFQGQSTIVNVGASFKDVDPIYSLNLTQSHPLGYNLVGYECDAKRVPWLRQKRPDVNIRNMCVTGPTLVKDLQELQVESRFSLLKTDIDSVDGPVLDSVLRVYQPYVVYAEIMWDFAPPVEFSLVQVAPSECDGGGCMRGFGPFQGGCFGMSLAMADHILRRNGYRLIEAAHANIMAVHEDVAHLFEDRPQDPWFWFQFVKSGLYHTHWMGAGRVNAETNSPLATWGQAPFYSEVKRADGNDNFKKPVVSIRTMDSFMAKIAERVQAGCLLSGKGNKYMLAVGDRCCAPQWGELEDCVCEFPDDAVDTRKTAA